MSKRRSDWSLPPEALGLVGTLLVVPTITVVMSLMLPILVQLKTAHVVALYLVGVGTGMLGSALLFLARLPLYRRRQFWTFGPGELDRKHRRLYWLAYGFISASLLLFCVVWLRIK